MSEEFEVRIRSAWWIFILQMWGVPWVLYYFDALNHVTGLIVIGTLGVMYITMLYVDAAYHLLSKQITDLEKASRPTT